MTHLRLTLLTCSMVASFAMTACGGGEATWAEDLKAKLNPTDKSAAANATSQAALAAVLPGEYAGPCVAFTALEKDVDSASIQVMVVTQQNGETLLTQREDLYDYGSCTDDAYVGSITQPTVKLTLDSEGTDVASGKRFLKVNASSAGGDVLFTVAPDAALTVSPVSSTTNKVTFDSIEHEILRPSKAPASMVKDVYALIDGTLYRGDSASRQPATTGFATALDLNEPFKPFKLFDVAPGTYRDACQPQGFGTAREYGVLAKQTFLQPGPDRRPRFTTSLEVYDNLNCDNNPLYIVRYPTASVDTVGNYTVSVEGGITVNARQVLVNYAEGPTEVILDQEAELSGLVSLSQRPSGPVVIFPTDNNNEVPYRNKSANTEKSLRYVSFSKVFVGSSDESTLDPVTGFPTKLEQNTTLFLQ